MTAPGIWPLFLVPVPWCLGTCNYQCLLQNYKMAFGVSPRLLAF